LDTGADIYETRGGILAEFSHFEGCKKGQEQKEVKKELSNLRKEINCGKLS
jgi:hypothetical protein